MTIENTLERIAVALEKIAAGKYEPVQTTLPLTASAAPAPVAEVKKPVEVVTPAPIQEAPVVTPTVVIAPVATPAPVTESPSSCPITNGKELMDYVMRVYKELGAAKGAEIQGVLNTLGCSAINEVRPDQYAALYAGIEALKA